MSVEESFHIEINERELVGRNYTMKRLDGKVTVITGATKGIGRATADLFYREGSIVVGGARNKVETEWDYHFLDVTDVKSCEKFFDYTVKKYKKVDCLVASAGIAIDSMTEKMTDEMFDKVIETNLKGVFNIVRFFGPHMKDLGGAIVILSSVVGEYGNFGQANYAASKAGLIGMAKSWAKEFSRNGISVRVNVIAPGYILTDMTRELPVQLIEKVSSATMLGRLGTPEEVAKAVLFLASEDSSYITGTVLDVNGGLRL